jgi:hypothetical protein
MDSVGDCLRRETALAVARLSPDERMALSLRLGDDDVSAYVEVHGATISQARAAFRRSRRVGRIPSPSHDGDAP